MEGGGYLAAFEEVDDVEGFPDARGEGEIAELVDELRRNDLPIAEDEDAIGGLDV